MQSAGQIGNGRVQEELYVHQPGGLALAGALGCDLGQKEFGGVRTIASGEQSADAVREAYQQMFNCPWHGSGWKVVIVASRAPGSAASRAASQATWSRPVPA